jgi:hypothetical protein
MYPVWNTRRWSYFLGPHCETIMIWIPPQLFERFPLILEDIKKTLPKKDWRYLKYLYFRFHGGDSEKGTPPWFCLCTDVWIDKLNLLRDGDPPWKIEQ